MIRRCILLVLLLVGSSADAETIAGRVVKVADGDTIADGDTVTVLAEDKRKIRIRFTRKESALGTAREAGPG